MVKLPTARHGATGQTGCFALNRLLKTIELYGQLFYSGEIRGGKMSQYLTFRLNNDLFAFDIGDVLEILSHTRITRVPRMPGFLSGVINLRGHIVPVVNLRLNLPVSAPTPDTCIVIIEIEMQAEKVMVGIWADDVSEVIDIEAENIFPPPKVGMRISSELLRCVGKKKRNL